MSKSRCVATSLLAVWLASQSAPITAYELRTHWEITQHAFDVSQGVATYLSDVGIDTSDIFDPGSATSPAQLDLFENKGRPRDWMIEGTIREDDYSHHPVLEGVGCQAPQNPDSPIDRMLNHFLDVQRGGQGLTVGGVTLGNPAPDWGLRKFLLNRNDFTILDARNYQLRSLVEAKPTDRDKNAALLFRALGQVIHLVQDMAQPQHTRSDPHSGCLSFIAGHKSWFEDYMERRAQGGLFRSRGEPSPTLILGGYPPPRFTAYRDFWTNGQQRGLADFSSRNFFSAGTNLSLFGNCGGLPEPPCSISAYRQVDQDFSYQTVLQSTVAGRVTLFLSTILDVVSQTTIPNVPVTSRSVWDEHLETRGFFSRFSLNTLNYDAIGDLLVPRAVGYSAGLLDYFFRGRLEVDLAQPDPNDPGVVQLTGTNASPEPLGDGTLTLYADDPAGSRSPAAPVLGDSTAVRNIGPGEGLASARFQAPPDAERFVAVYQGTLGQEAPTGDAPGAVIGKVLGGARVEEIFAEGDYWKLRTPTGIFLLQEPTPAGPQLLTTAGYLDVRWGDGENLLVARTPWGEPTKVVGFELPRQENSIEPKTESSPDGPVIPLVQKATADFPFDLPLGITAHLSHTVRYRQQIAKVQWKTTWYYFRDVHTALSGYFPPNFTVETPLTIVTVLEDTIPLQASYPLVLDRAHNWTLGGLGIWDYWWDVQEVTLTASGHLLALVYAGLATVSDAHQQTDQRPIYSLTPAGELKEDGHVTFRIPFEHDNMLWALVDLTTRQVLASTSSAAIRVTTEEYVEQSPWSSTGALQASIWGQIIDRYEGGPGDPREEVQDWTLWPISAWSVTHQTAEAAVLTELHTETGTSQIAATWLGGDMAVALTPDLLTYHVTSQEDFRDFGYPCADEGGCAIRLIEKYYEIDEWPADLSVAQRARPAPPAGERLLFSPEIWSDRINTSPVVVWDLGAGRADVRFRLDVAAWSGAALGPATGEAVLVTGADYSTRTVTGYLVPLDGPATPLTIPNVDFRTGYTLLAPRFVYNTEAQRFYRLTPPFGLTPLPRRLAPGGDPIGDYHAVRVP